MRARPPTEHPLAARYEEMDAVAIFDEVVVPWERVFLQGDIGLLQRPVPRDARRSPTGFTSS